MAEKLKITFRIHYHTEWGEQLMMVGSIPELGSDDHENALIMHWEGEGFWRVAIDVNDGSTFQYKYLLKNRNGVLITEFGKRLFSATKNHKNALVLDQWLRLDNPHHSFFSSAFTHTVFKRSRSLILPKQEKVNARLAIRAPRIPQNLHLCVSGDTPALGNWDPEKPLLMEDSHFPNWTCNFYTDDSYVEYKYGLYDPDEGRIVQWEESDNRVLHISKNYDVTVQNDEILRVYTEWKGAGLAIPVFSIRTENSMGCGEFNDLCLLTDWASKNGLKIIQVLPINDTISTYTWRDSYPYNAISVNALHPIYLHIPALFKRKSAALKAKIREAESSLNKIDHVDFEKVLTTKLAFARMAFEADKRAFIAEPEFKAFREKNESWLLPYAMYCFLRDYHGTSDFRKWKNFNSFNERDLNKELKANATFATEVDFFCFLQYHLDKQLAESISYARSKGIIVKGDIPIGINRNGVEAWQEPHLFNFTQQAGAPPDDFAVNGQNWGFPTYNWDVMEAEGYRWWKLRFGKMADYFDAYRIDHILGFFRIWEIPLAYSEGLMGHFNPALPLSETELRSYGIDFNYNRHCKAYITKDILKELFNAKSDWIQSTFFEENDFGLQFKPGFDTELKLMQYCASINDKSILKEVMEELRFLHYEVLLIPDDKPGFYFPRIAMQFTRSFQQLPPHQKTAFNTLYDTFYYHRHDEFWGHEGRKKLEILVNSTDMLVCGEDLGMIPNCVEGVMDHLKILSLEVQRMPKNEQQLFGKPKNYPYLSVCTPATHDMSTLRGWWEEDLDLSQEYYKNILKKWGKAPVKCEPWLNTLMVQNQLEAHSMITILSMQDWLNCEESTLNKCKPEDERINIPKNPRHYWKYRMHLTLEELMMNAKLNTSIQHLLQITNRV